MLKYTVKQVPNITLKYVDENAKNRKVIFDTVEDYRLEIQPSATICQISFRIADKGFWDTFKKSLMTYKLHDFTLTATNVRRNVETNEDEEYKELNAAHFNNCNCSYDFSCEGNPTKVLLTFIDTHCENYINE